MKDEASFHEGPQKEQKKNLKTAKEFEVHRYFASLSCVTFAAVAGVSIYATWLLRPFEFSSALLLSPFVGSDLNASVWVVLASASTLTSVCAAVIFLINVFLL
eukprot:GHVP01054642.1.p1 GENE.GHVP01054642.1~~GHVP01054642.1.p1  ORF type:complete len:103 (-),score=19.35 GHVP01054642.1:21-329(-)